MKDLWYQSPIKTRGTLTEDMTCVISNKGDMEGIVTETKNTVVFDGSLNYGLTLGLEQR